MKRNFGKILTGALIAALIMLLALTASAADIVDSGNCGTDFGQKNVTWTLDSDGVLTISGSGEMKDYNTFNESPWYDNNTNIKTVIIDNGITNIGGNAFRDCTNLENVTIGNNVTGIEDSAFYGCTSLKSIIIPDNVTGIGNSAFDGCTSLESITFPNNITNIGTDAFYNTGYYNNDLNWEDNLLYIDNLLIFCKKEAGSCVIREGTTKIASYAFAGSQVTSVSFPENEIYIGYRAFFECIELESVTIPQNATLGMFVFEGCENLTEATLEEGIKATSWGMFFRCHNLKTVNLPSTIEEIAPETFKECGVINMTNIDKIKSVGEFAFMSCPVVLNLHNLTGFGPQSFSFSNLISITVPENTYLIEKIFIECPALMSVTIEDGVNEIRDYAFYNCFYLKSITIPASVEYIGDFALGYYYDSETETDCKIEGFKIFGTPGTAAETYATENGFEFTDITTHTHNYKFGIVATYDCFTDDIGIYLCECGAYNGLETIPSTGHTESDWIIDREPDCWQTGRKYKCCTVCKTTTAEEVIPTTSHTEGEWEIVYDSTCYREGLRYNVCSGCNNICKEEPIPKKPHANTIPIGSGYSASCTSTGLTEGKMCDQCGETVEAQKEISKLSHSDGDGDGYCDNCDAELEKSFFDKIRDFFNDFFEKIRNFFANLFG